MFIYIFLILCVGKFSINTYYYSNLFLLRSEFTEM